MIWGIGKKRWCSGIKFCCKRIVQETCTAIYFYGRSLFPEYPNRGDQSVFLFMCLELMLHQHDGYRFDNMTSKKTKGLKYFRNYLVI